MKILFVASSNSDYLQNLTYSGLVKILGRNSVKLIPWKHKVKSWVATYPKNMDKSFADLVHPINIKSIQPDIVIVGSSRPDCLNRYLRIVKSISPKTKTIFLDGGDRPELAGDTLRIGSNGIYQAIENSRPFDFIAKREYLKGDCHPSNVFPLPFSYNFDCLPVNSSATFKYDVSFWAVESHPVRTQALTLLNNQFDCKSNGTVLNQSFSGYQRKGIKYLQELAACKIVLNFRGGGWDTLRYWEVPALGRLMISGEPGIIIPNNFRHKQEIVFCDDNLENMIDLIKFYLKNQDSREKIAHAGYQHAIEFHSDKARAKYFLSQIEKGSYHLAST